jgi:hypothetical protein
MEDKDIKDIKIYLTNNDSIHFAGKYLRERQQANWHYYEGEKGEIYHFRKEHMVCVIEKEIKKI